VRGIAIPQGGQAALNLMNWDSPFGTRESLFPSGTLERRIQTRLGAGDRLVRFDKPFVSAFGQSCHTLTIPSHLVSGADDKTEPEYIETDAGKLRFRFGNRRYRYDRLGLRHMRD